MSSPKPEDLEENFTRETEIQTITNGNLQTSEADIEEDVVVKDKNVDTNTNFIFTNIDKDQFYQLSKTLADFYDREMKYSVPEPQKRKTRSPSEVVNDPLSMEIKIRDFGFPIDDSRHWGHPYPSSDEEDEDTGENEYTNRRARALYDFQAENPTELSFQEGDILLIQDRQCEGWLIADLGEETGLVPENYVALLGDDEEEEDEYGDWANEEQ